MPVAPMTLSEIVALLEKADDGFKQLSGVPEEALSLWNEALDKIGAALWMYEKTSESGG